MNFKRKTLKNGVRLITVPTKESPSAAVMVMVEAGSNYEKKENNGISHFLEHMVFKGTEKRPSSKIIHRELDSLGAEMNAFTANEFTAYHAKAEKKQWKKMLDILSDMYLNPLIPEIDLEKERGVILQEISRKEDKPDDLVWEKLDELLYSDTPAGRMVLGTAANIKKFSRQDFIDYHSAHYIAEKTIVIVVGDLKQVDVEKEVMKRFKNIPQGKKLSKFPVKEYQRKPGALVYRKNTDQMHLILAMRSYGAKDKRSPALLLLASILGKGFSSRLFEKLRDQMGACYYVRADNDEYTDHGRFVISTGIDPKRSREIIKAILDECKNIANIPLTEEELKKVKDYVIGNMYLSLETSDALAVFYALSEGLKGKSDTPKAIERKIRAVTAKDIMKVAKDIFRNDNLNIAVVGNISNTASLKKALRF